MIDPCYGDLTTEQAMEILGPIRSAWVQGKHDTRKPCWLDGKHAPEADVKKAAMERLDELWDRGPWEPKNG